MMIVRCHGWELVRFRSRIWEPFEARCCSMKGDEGGDRNRDNDARRKMKLEREPSIARDTEGIEGKCRFQVERRTRIKEGKIENRVQYLVGRGEIRRWCCRVDIDGGCP
ncbi:hypothetical protein ACLOJK_027611 [Asimina triloba]